MALMSAIQRRRVGRSNRLWTSLPTHVYQSLMMIIISILRIFKCLLEGNHRKRKTLWRARCVMVFRGRGRGCKICCFFEVMPGEKKRNVKTYIGK
jgi:hypothetical protein